MLKIPAQYDRDTSPGKIKGLLTNFLLLCCSVSLLVTARELWWVNQE
jgi:hypothetical protein